jgi:membrane protein DedA with SNARE-associated domain
MHIPYDTLRQWLEQYGYVAIVLSLVLEYVVFVIPGETFLILAGAYATTGHLNLLLVMLCGALGAALGANNGYLIGRWGGQVFLDRYAHRFHIGPERLEQMQRFFARHGDKTVFFARFLTVVRILVGYFAGAHRMPYARFTVYNVLGASVWAVAVTLLGYLFAANLGLLRHILTDVGIVAVLLAAGLFYLIYVRRREERL